MNLKTNDIPQDLKGILNVDFTSSQILKNAFVHRSYLNEHPSFELPSNERLEFLGDAVLQFLTSAFLYTQYDQDEGLLTNYRSSLVNTVSLAELSRRMNLGQYLFLAKGEEANGGRDREYILANTFEAFLGALYLEQGIESCKKLLEKVLFPGLKSIIENHQYRDYKSLFQEKAQEKFNATPIYEVQKEWGPDHDKHFEVGLVVNKKTLSVGEGKSKQKAEQDAAQKGLESLWPQG